MSRWLAWVVGSVAVSACASNDTIAVSDGEYDDVALALASTIQSADGGELSAMLDVVELAGGRALAGFSEDATGHHGQRRGLEFHYTVMCHDAAGLALSSCERAAEAVAVASWDGALELPYQALGISRASTWSIMVATPNVATLDGEGHGESRSVFDSPDRTSAVYDLAYTTRYEGVELARGNAWPTAGTIHHGISAQRTRQSANRSEERDFEVDAIIELGGRHVTMVFDDVRGYRLDLVTGAIVAVD